jgi:uncharacterized protein (DUF58 family)
VLADLSVGGHGLVDAMRPIVWLTNRGEILNRDFLPGLVPYVRWLKTPLGSLGSAAVAAGLCGMFLHPQGFVVFFGLLAVMLLGLAWPWLSVRGLSGSLGFDRPRCREGEPVAARITVRNRMPWGVWGVSIKGGFHRPGRDGGEDGPLSGLVFIPGRRTIETCIEFVPDCRGQYPEGPPRLACGFPFGLRESARPLEVAAPLLVWPRTVPVGPVPDAEGSHASDGLAARDRAGNWGDPLGVRPYRRGDPLRRVHWGLSARHGELIVREVQSNAVPRVRIVLDSHAAAHDDPGPDGSLEWAIRIAASLAEGWIGQGAEVELVLEGNSILPRGGSARTRSRAVLDALARFRPAGDRDLADLVGDRDGRSRGGGLRVVITTDVGLRGSKGEIRRRDSDRYVVLKAGAFGSDTGGPPADSLPVVPWILIDGPGYVATCFRRAAKEVSLGR